MNKVSEIVRSWWIAANPTPEQSALAQKRIKICNECSYREKSVVYGFVCGECGCPLGKKIFSPVVKGACKIGKWDNL
jgi:hypothetical protein